MYAGYPTERHKRKQCTKQLLRFEITEVKFYCSRRTIDRQPLGLKNHWGTWKLLRFSINTILKL